jgi:glycosyltransferase involved in cell wall biosynthesis
MSPRVTVLIPNYNGAQFLEHCFNGLLMQSIQDFECIFLDDGSSDTSLEVANQYLKEIPQLQIKAFSNGGIATNWNRGMALVNTEFFTLLHCDDSYEPGYLEAMLGLMDAFPAAGLGHCASQAMNAHSNPVFSLAEFYKHAKFLSSKAFQRSIEDEYRLLLESDFINCPSVIYRSSAAHKIGNFDVGLEQTLDWDYWFRTLRAGYTICGTNQKLYLYRRHASNHTVVNSKKMTRYSEELACVKGAYQKGLETGLCADGALNTSGLRNIVIVDIAAALRAGNVEATVSLRKFLEEYLAVSKLTSRAISIAIGLKQTGGYLLSIAIQFAVVAVALQTKAKALLNRRPIAG